MVSSTDISTPIRRVLILGHTGFIGSHLVEAFQNRTPEVEVEVVGRSTATADLTQEEAVANLADKFCDLETAVIMCAAIKRQFGDTLDVFSENLKMTTNLCRLLANHPVRRFIFFSSAAVYGEDVHNTNITEETLPQPTSYYGIVKYTSERLYRKVIDAQEQSSLVILRPPTIYGPGDKGGTYGPVRFSEAAIKNEPITLWGDGTELREFVFVDDIVNLVHRLVFHTYDGVINLAAGKSYTFKTVLDIVADMVPHDLQISSRPRTKNKVDNAFDNQHLVKLLPDISFTPLDEGIKQIFAAHA